MMVVVEGENVLHHVEMEVELGNYLGAGNVRGKYVQGNVWIRAWRRSLFLIHSLITLYQLTCDWCCWERV